MRRTLSYLLPRWKYSYDPYTSVKSLLESFLIMYVPLICWSISLSNSRTQLLNADLQRSFFQHIILIRTQTPIRRKICPILFFILSPRQRVKGSAVISQKVTSIGLWFPFLLEYNIPERRSVATNCCILLLPWICLASMVVGWNVRVSRDHSSFRTWT